MPDPEPTAVPPVVTDAPVTDPPATETPPVDPVADKPEDKPEDKPADDTPKEYTDFTLPEGMTADQPLLDGFKETARELGLPQDGAQKLVDLYSGVLKSQSDAADKQKADWEAEIQKDPAHQEMLGLAKRTVEKFADADTQQLLEDTVIGSHPGLIRFLAAVGKATSEDRMIEAGAGGGNTLSLADRVYGKK